MNNFMAKVRVVAKALPTWLALASSVLVILAAEVVPELSGDTQAQVAGWIAAALGVLAAATATIRKLTPVLDPSQWGLLPKPDGGDPGGDAGSVTVELIAICVAVSIVVVALYHVIFVKA